MTYEDNMCDNSRRSLVSYRRLGELERKQARRLASSSRTMASSANTTAPAGAGGAAPALPALDNTFGAMFLGTVFGQMLYGLTVYQTYKYFRLFAKDTLFHKVLVLTVLVLETFHAVLCIHVCYYYVITNYFNPVALTKDIWYELLPHQLNKPNEC
ncbi:hypothetical protein OH77DRAFT_415673 [Trametes cingulata]|nr:hypothetical protein OH77DRAFT_415673 [Trametes cingulata]